MNSGAVGFKAVGGFDAFVEKNDVAPVETLLEALENGEPFSPSKFDLAGAGPFDVG